MSAAVPQNLAARLASVLTLDPDAVAVECKTGTTCWRDIAAASERIETLLVAAGVPRDAPVGWVARNRPSAVAAFAALVIHGRMVVPLRPRQVSATLPDELAAQRLQAVIGDEDDWADADVIPAALAAGSLGIAISGSSPISVRLVPELSTVGPGPHREPAPGIVLERLTSGTTGTPKRIAVAEAVLVPSLRSGEQKADTKDEGPLCLKTSPAILLKPFSHAGGLFGLLLALYQARPTVLIERFDPVEWAEIVRHHGPRSASLVPAMIKMIIDAGIPRDALASLKAIRAGTAPLDPQMQAQFEERYGVPILVDYGAAEFIGGVAGWTLADHRQYAVAKRGSVGRPRADVRLKITAEGGTEALPIGQIGILQIHCERFGPDWFRTNDLALIDADGFLFLHGRADDAINRGGFKVLPEEVAMVLRRYPGIRDAAVVAAPDPRLGQVPIAALEMAEGAARPTAADLDAFLRQQLAAYMVPKEFRFVETLPRTASMKISRPELKALLGLADPPRS